MSAYDLPWARGERNLDIYHLINKFYNLYELFMLLSYYNSIKMFNVEYILTSRMSELVKYIIV